MSHPPRRDARPHQAVKDHFATNVERLRRDKGITSEELAGRSSIEPRELREILRGNQEAGYGTIARLAAALGVNPGDLFDGIAWISPDVGEGRLEVDEG
jgi:transcriptional regulator with XRE-family HTH domain